MEGEKTNTSPIYGSMKARKAPGYKDGAVKVLAVIGLLTVLGGGTFTLVSLAHYSGPMLSRIAAAAVSLTSVFTPKQVEPFVVSASAPTVNSGESVSLSFTPSKTNGSYSLTYPCVDGFRLDIPSADGSIHSVSCNTAYNFVSNSGSLSLTPISEKNRYVDMPVTISFIDAQNPANTLSSSVTITVANEKVSDSTSYVNEQTGGTSVTIPGNTPTTPAPKKPATTPSTSGQTTSKVYTYPVTGTVTENPNGKADLKVSVLEVGVVDKISGAFAKTDNLSRADRVGVRFSVENKGDKSSGSWKFNAILPTFPPYTFNSDDQQTLAPGDKIDFTIGFDQTIAGTDDVKFVVDPQEKVTESDETNNTVTIQIVVK